MPKWKKIKDTSCEIGEKDGKLRCYDKKGNKLFGTKKKINENFPLRIGNCRARLIKGRDMNESGFDFKFIKGKKQKIREIRNIKVECLK